ncbi:anaphase-promoting complex protein [Ordospora pajunii]|uniref:anaphase-promoting complex protein n=1 Tax=Ordospora pajunii TaxID=3039483 RepID=UPI002952745C|nr:anaphase-promoting complex protein [Ordospora pajunii]KAH9411082.1 anaphase-promoting complex protein [Ordospora pajunii]
MGTIDIKIKKVYPVYAWKWNIDDDICGICQQGFDQVCSKCKHPIDCKPCTGKCRHTFHVHCLSLWLQQKKVCPMCRMLWEYHKMFE